MRLFTFLLGTLFFAFHLLFYKRVLKRVRLPLSVTRLLTLLIWGNYLMVLLYLLARYGWEPPRFLYYLSSLSIGIGFLLFLGWLLYETVTWLHRLFPSPRLKHRVDLLFMTGFAVLTLLAIYGGAQPPLLKKITIDQHRFNRPYRIVQISDMHIGGLVDREFVERCVSRINALHPDLVVITGDLVDARIEKIRHSLAPLARLQSRFGLFYVPGNHEYFHGIDTILAYLPKLGMTVLENRAVKIDNAFWVMGVDDLMGLRRGRHRPDIEKAYRDRKDGAPVLLLAHQPRFIKKLANHHPALMLCGHTHGGQVWPFQYLVARFQPFVKSLHVIGKNRHIYVNSGIGFWGPPMRLGSRAEIAVIEWR